MNTALWWLGQNTITVALLIPLVLVACRVCRNRPAVQHVLWLVVLLKFVTPPIVAWPLTAQEIRESFWSSPVAATEPLDFPNEKQKPVEPVELDPPTVPAVADRPTERDVAADLSQPADGPVGERPVREIPIEHADAAPTPVAPVPDRISFAELAVPVTLSVWLGGAILCLLSQLRRIVRHAALVRRGSRAPESLTVEIAATAKRLGMRPPRAVLARGILSPFMWCLGRLRLVWPEVLSSEAEVVRSRGVIAHELAHVRRGDHWIAWLELIAGIVWWWNPLFWFVRRRLRETAEMACDALAIGTNPESRREYAELLLELSAGFKTGAPAPVLAVSAGTPSSFERRLSMILSDRVSGKMSWWGLFVAIVFGLVALPGWSLGQEQPRTQPKEPPSVTPKDRPTLELPKAAGEVPVENKRDIAEIEAQIQKLENEIRRLHKLLEDRKATASPVPNAYVPAKEERLDADKRKAIIEVAKAQLEKATADYQRFTQLHKQGAITEQQLETAKKQLAEATANLKQLEAFATFTKSAPNNFFDPNFTVPNNTKTAYWAQEREVKFFSLQYARAVDVSRILKDLFPEDEARNPRISADERSNSLIIRGTAKDREAIEAIVERLEHSSADAIKKGESVKPRDSSAPKPVNNRVPTAIDPRVP